MDIADLTDDRRASDFLKSLDPAQVGTAFSKLFSASIGDLVIVFSHSPAHKHYSLADIEWMVIPPVFAGQFYVVEAMDKKHGFRTPVAAVTWAFVSEGVDQLLQKQAESLRRLRPDQWNCGSIGWLIDAAGDAEGVRRALQWLAAGPFKEQPLKMTLPGAGGTTVTTLKELLAGRSESARAAV
jgi:hemolysin-activating ACP:hemolysin acyltransferase